MLLALINLERDWYLHPKNRVRVDSCLLLEFTLECGATEDALTVQRFAYKRGSGGGWTKGRWKVHLVHEVKNLREGDGGE